jgi:hypothetical protein
MAQVPAVALDRISQGGTQGLIYALTGAVAALALSGAWLLREHLRAAAKHADTIQAVQTRHAEAMQKVQTDQSTEILKVQGASAATLQALTERVTESMGAMHVTARDLRDAITSAQEMTRTLELTLDRAAIYSRDDPGGGRDPLREESQHGRNAPRPPAPARRRGQET